MKVSNGKLLLSLFVPDHCLAFTIIAGQSAFIFQWKLVFPIQGTIYNLFNDIDTFLQLLN